MPLQLYKIASTEVGSTAVGFVEFTNIPSGYTDLKIVYSLRGNGTEGMYVQFNGSTANFTGRYLYSDGANAYSGILARYIGSITAAANSYSNGELYIPNYSGSNNKSFSVDEVFGQNSTTGFNNIAAGLWSQSTAINSVRIEAASNINQYSTATLYGIL
jgi:hypothetical protein